MGCDHIFPDKRQLRFRVYHHLHRAYVDPAYTLCLLGRLGVLLGSYPSPQLDHIFHHNLLQLLALLSRVTIILAFPATRR